MSDAVVQEFAVTKSDQACPAIEKNQAVSITLPFAIIKRLLSGSPAPGRPSRNRPVPLVDPELRAELDAWEAASDEAFESTEGSLPE